MASRATLNLFSSCAFEEKLLIFVQCGLALKQRSKGSHRCLKIITNYFHPLNKQLGNVLILNCNPAEVLETQSHSKESVVILGPSRKQRVKEGTKLSVSQSSVSTSWKPAKTDEEKLQPEQISSVPSSIANKG